MKPHYKAIILVLASDNNYLYKQFREVYKQYLNSHSDIKVFLVYGNNVDFKQQEHDLVFDVEENYYPGMITKTLLALDYVNKNYSYDYVIRTNLSTFWVFDKLLYRLSSLPKLNCFTGKGRSCTYKQVKSPIYISGVNLVISADLVDPIVDKADLVTSWDLPEDWALTKFYTEYMGLKPKFTSPASMHFMEKFLDTAPEPILLEIAEANKLNKDHFRVKNLKDRDAIDIAVMNLLLKEYYDKALV